MKTKSVSLPEILQLSAVKSKIIILVSLAVGLLSILAVLAAGLSELSKANFALTPSTEGCFAFPSDKTKPITYPAGVYTSTVGSCLAYYSTSPNSATCWDHTGGILNQEDVDLNKCLSLWRTDTGSRRYSFCPGKSCNTAVTVTPFAVNITSPNLTGCFTTNSNISFSATASGPYSSYTYSWSFGDGGVATGQNVSHTFTNTAQNNITVIAKPTGQDIQATQTISLTMRSSCANVTVNDNDGDGVPNELDKCSSPTNLPVNSDGCTTGYVCDSINNNFSCQPAKDGANQGWNECLNGCKRPISYYPSESDMGCCRFYDNGYKAQDLAKNLCRTKSIYDHPATWTIGTCAGPTTYYWCESSTSIKSGQFSSIADCQNNRKCYTTADAARQNAAINCPATNQTQFWCDTTTSCSSGVTCPANKKCYGSGDNCKVQATKDCGVSTAQTGCCIYYGILGLTKQSGIMTKDQCTAKNKDTFCGVGTTCNSDKTCGPNPSTDLCPNIDGTQVSMPAGMLADASGNCYSDRCNNIEGLQIQVPSGYVEVNGSCQTSGVALTAAISGTIYKASSSAFLTGGGVLSGAGVSAYINNSNGQFSIYATARSGTDGKYFLSSLPQASRYGVKASADGYLPVCRSLSAPSNNVNFVLYPIVQPNNDPRYDCVGTSRPAIRNELQQGLTCLMDKVSTKIETGYTLRFTSFGRCSLSNKIGSDCHDRGLAADFVPQYNGKDHINATEGYRSLCLQFKDLANQCGLKFIDERSSQDYINDCGFIGSLSNEPHFHVAACNCTSGQAENCSSAINNYSCSF